MDLESNQKIAFTRLSLNYQERHSQERFTDKMAAEPKFQHA